MIDTWLDLARGPLFYFAFTLMILGLMRHIVLTWTGIRRILRTAGNPSMPYGAVLKATLLWLFPFNKMNPRIPYSILSVIFHLGLILTPIFLAAHILLWKRGTGLFWPAFSQDFADYLTLVTIAAGIGLIIGRAANRHSRAISRAQDFILPILLGVLFLSGFLAGHPSMNPFSYKTMLLLHVMTGNAVFVLIPFTKLAHAVLVPTAQLISEAAWHFPADSGVNVAQALQKEANQV
jgi:nitrate reductase gamma subunit